MAGFGDDGNEKNIARPSLQIRYDKILQFVQEHRDADPLKLLLQQAKYPDIDLRLVAQQLEGLRQASAKWPTLASCATYVYPPKLNREQSSSEATARYKGALFARLGGGTFADLTGGMGIDALFLAQQASQGHYVEMDAALCDMARHNFSALRQVNMSVHQGDSMAWIADAEHPFDLVYIDPARRDARGRKVAAFEDCTPNLLGNLELILRSTRYLLVKASPMIDISVALRELGMVEEVHVVAVGGECKEVLFLLSRTEALRQVAFHCVDLQKGIDVSFTRVEEQEAEPLFADVAGRYLYEPNAALMKGGCYNSLCAWHRVQKLARNTHLYTSDTIVSDFPGRIFEVLQELPMNAKEVAKAVPERRAHVATRNYPLSAADLQKKLKISEGGTLFIIAATLGTRPKGWLCRQLH